ncbi:MAG: lysine--tRNA ligase, partial [Spirochaetaceae bacterium]|nr:lysine--tRNA ligase [Spirochaetaceae bacterium]
ESVLKELPGLAPAQETLVRKRAACAWYWIEECAPDDFRFAVRKPGEKAGLTETETLAIRHLRDDVVAQLDVFADEKLVAEAIYKAAEAAGVDGKTLFRAAYQALIAKDQGPRLAGFLRTLGKEKVLAILSAY